MRLFGNILERLGMRRGAAASSPAPSAPAPEPEVTAAEPVSPPAAEAPAAVEVPVVDVVSLLEEKAAANPQKLNWKTSIVDLLKLLDIDSSYGARKELAKELSCPENLMSDSASMNMWLHKEVLRKIAENGGNVPDSLLG